MTDLHKQADALLPKLAQVEGTRPDMTDTPDMVEAVARDYYNYTQSLIGELPTEECPLYRLDVRGPIEFAIAAMQPKASAEVERLGALIETAAQHWLDLQFEHPIQWEGAIDGAMKAGCAEIKRLRTALAASEAKAGKLREALDEADDVFMEHHGGVKAADPRLPAIDKVWRIIRQALKDTDHADV